MQSHLLKSSKQINKYLYLSKQIKPIISKRTFCEPETFLLTSGVLVATLSLVSNSFSTIKQNEIGLRSFLRKYDNKIRQPGLQLNLPVFHDLHKVDMRERI